jgi:hypothetical protein
MTDYTALGAAAETLRALLQEHITDSDHADLKAVPVDIRSPHELKDANVTQAVSVWLYRLALQPDLLNAPRPRTGDGEFEHRPLPLELSFLITSLHPDTKTQLALAGRTLQIVDDHCRLRGAMLKDALAGTDAELRLSIDATTLIETSDLWYSLQTPFRLAVPVRMQVASIRSHLQPTEGPPVLTRHTRTGQLVAGAP